jgi:uncharacterized protein (UPF0335 family)
MSTDLDELKALVAALKADQQAQREKEKRDAWTKYVSLSMICLAVLAAIATQRGAGYSSATMKQLNEATFNQAEASDQWAYYQAKGIKQSIYELERDRATTGGATIDPKVLAGLSAKVERYEAEKKEITKEAKGFEAKRDTARELSAVSADRGREMGLATTFFQIAIALGGVCLVVKKRGLWFISLGVGLLASAQMFRVFLLR